MASALVSSMAIVPGATSESTEAARWPTYRTKTSFVAVSFDQAGRGRIVFLPFGAVLRVVGPSSVLPEGFEVTFERRLYNVFEIDLVTRSILISEAPPRARAVCA